MIEQIRNWMQVHTKKGTFQPEIQSNQYQTQAHTIWMIITFWMTQQKVRGIKMGNEGAFKEAIWNQFLPIFKITDLG